MVLFESTSNIVFVFHKTTTSDFTQVEMHQNTFTLGFQLLPCYYLPNSYTTD